MIFVPTKPLERGPGSLIAQRRRALGKTLDGIDEESGGLIYRQMLYRLEHGHKKSDSLTWDQTYALANALEWTVEKLNAVLGVSGEERGPQAVRGKGGAVPVVGDLGRLADGRRAGDIGVTGEYYMLDEREYLTGSDYFIYRVTQTTLVAQDVSPSMQPGMMLIVEQGDAIKGNQVGLYYSSARRLDVVARHGRQNVLLVGGAPGGEVLWRSDLADMRLVGVVRRFSGEL